MPIMAQNEGGTWGDRGVGNEERRRKWRGGETERETDRDREGDQDRERVRWTEDG